MCLHTYYHFTDGPSKRSIEDSGMLQPSSHGAFGPGVYLTQFPWALRPPSEIGVRNDATWCLKIQLPCTQLCCGKKTRYCGRGVFLFTDAVNQSVILEMTQHQWIPASEVRHEMPDHNALGSMMMNGPVEPALVEWLSDSKEELRRYAEARGKDILALVMEFPPIFGIVEPEGEHSSEFGHPMDIDQSSQECLEECFDIMRLAISQGSFQCCLQDTTQQRGSRFQAPDFKLLSEFDKLVQMILCLGFDELKNKGFPLDLVPSYVWAMDKLFLIDGPYQKMRLAEFQKRKAILEVLWQHLPEEKAAAGSKFLFETYVSMFKAIACWLERDHRFAQFIAEYRASVQDLLDKARPSEPKFGIFLPPPIAALDIPSLAAYLSAKRGKEGESGAEKKGPTKGHGSQVQKQGVGQPKKTDPNQPKKPDEPKKPAAFPANQQRKQHIERHGISEQEIEEITSNARNIVSRNRTEDGRINRIYIRGNVEVRTSQAAGQDEVVGTAFSPPSFRNLQ